MSLKLSEIYHYEQMADWLGTSGQPKESQFSLIGGAGYSAVVNLALPDSDNAIPEEGRVVTALGMAYFHIPVRFEAPQVDDLRVFFGVLDALKGKKIWVHCVVNARVSVFVYHYLTKRMGIPADDARSVLLNKWEPEMDSVWQDFLGIDMDTLAS